MMRINSLRQSANSSANSANSGNGNDLLVDFPEPRLSRLSSSCTNATNHTNNANNVNDASGYGGYGGYASGGTQGIQGVQGNALQGFVSRALSLSRESSLKLFRQNSSLSVSDDQAAKASSAASAAKVSKSSTNANTASDTVKKQKKQKKSVTFCHRSVLHQYEQYPTPSTLFYNKQDRQQFQAEAMTAVKNIRKVMKRVQQSQQSHRSQQSQQSQSASMMETDMIHLSLQATARIRGTEPEEIVGVEHLIGFDRKEHLRRREMARGFIEVCRRRQEEREQQREQMQLRQGCGSPSTPPSPSEQDVVVLKQYKNATREAAQRAKRRADYVIWMIDLPDDIKLSSTS